MKIIIKLSVLVVLFAIMAFIKSPDSKLSANPIIILVKNQTDNAIRIQTDENYLNIGDYHKIIYKKTDTLQIDADRTLFYYLSHKGSYIDTLLASPGDTILVSANANSLTAEVKSKFKTNELIQEALLAAPNTVLKKKIDSLSNLFYRVNDKVKPLEVYDEFSKDKKYPIQINRKALVDRKVDFNTLLLLLEEDYQKNKIPANRSLIGGADFLQAVNYKLQIDYFKKLNMLQLISGSTEVKQKMISSMFINQETLSSPYAKSILLSYLKNHLITKKPEFSRSKEHVFYDQAYDNAGNYLKGDLLKYAKFLALEKMFEFDEPAIELSSRYKDFVSVYKDDRLNKILQSKFDPILNSTQDTTNDLLLTDVSGKSESLNSILKMSKGSLVYVDFWASWCSPCRDAMPDSKMLVKEFMEKNIKFIYLSIDKNKELWAIACKVEKLSGPESYLVMNQSSASILKQIKMTEIPKYILFDKNGNLVHPNAPGPKGEAIRELILKYL